MRRSLSLMTAFAVMTISVGLGAPAQAEEPETPAASTVQEPTPPATPTPEVAPAPAPEPAQVAPQATDPAPAPAPAAPAPTAPQVESAEDSAAPAPAPAPAPDAEQEEPEAPPVDDEDDPIDEVTVPALGGDTSVYAGDPATLFVSWMDATESNALTGVLVLQRLAGDTWVNVKSVFVNEGFGNTQVRPTEDTTYRVVGEKTESTPAAESAPHTVTIIDESALVEPEITLTPERTEVGTGETTLLTVNWSNASGEPQDGYVVVQHLLPGQTEWVDVYGEVAVDGVAVVEVYPTRATAYRAQTPQTETTRRGTSAPVTITAVPADDEPVIDLTGPRNVDAGQMATLNATWANGTGARQSGEAIVQVTSPDMLFEWENLTTITFTNGEGRMNVTPKAGDTYYRVLTPENRTVQAGQSEAIIITSGNDPGNGLAAADVTLSGDLEVPSGDAAFNINWSNQVGVPQDGLVVVEVATNPYSTQWSFFKAVQVTDGLGGFVYPIQTNTAFRVLTPENRTTAAGESNILRVSVVDERADASLAITGGGTYNAGTVIPVTARWENTNTTDGLNGDVTFEYRATGSDLWVPLTTTTAVDGDVTANITIPKTGQVRATAPGTTTTNAVGSDPVGVSIRQVAKVTLTGDVKAFTGRDVTLTGGWSNTLDERQSGTGTLERRTAGTSSWETLTTPVTFTDGVATVTVNPTESTDYRIVTPATANTQAGSSTVRTVTVTRPASTITTSGDLTVDEGEDGTVTVRFVAEDGQLLSGVLNVQRRDSDGNWVTIDRVTVNAPANGAPFAALVTAVVNGTTMVTLNPTETTEYRFTADQSETYLAGESAPFTITIDDDDDDHGENGDGQGGGQGDGNSPSTPNTGADVNTPDSKTGAGTVTTDGKNAKTGGLPDTGTPLTPVALFAALLAIVAGAVMVRKRT